MRKLSSLDASMLEKRGSKDSAFAHAYAVILAGGSGTRFWPMSRRRRPKQLIELFGRGTLLEQAVQRVRRVIPPERIYVFTSELVHGEVVRRLRDLPASQIVAEPAQRNTAPTLGLAAHEVLRRDPNGVMVILPSDHIIRKNGAFLKALQVGCQWAATEGRSVVLGIRPTRPEIGYGYVRLGPCAAQLKGQTVFHVDRFTEKPKAATARRYVSSGRYLWNAGMFIWRASALIGHLDRFQPGMAQGLDRIARSGGVQNQRTLRQLFPRLEKISIDYALMEKIPQVFAVPVDIGWSDVGSWAVVYDLSRKDVQGNVRPEQSLAWDAYGNFIQSGKKFVVAVGVRDLVIVETDDALLISARERSQDVGKAVEELERQGLKKLL